MNSSKNLFEFRKNYTRDGFSIEQSQENPFAQFNIWLEQAIEARLPEPNAMVLSTVSSSAKVSSRTVLLKEADGEGFVFFTNFNSRKANDLLFNPSASLVFLWLELERQVRIEGSCRKIMAEESDAYFATRPRESQLGAWASDQSEEIASREILLEKYLALEKQWENQPIPRPPHWGGYRLYPDTFEFWQGRPGRMHDRIVYWKDKNQQTWKRRRLSP